MQVSHYKWSDVRSTAKGLNLLDVSQITEVSFFGRSMLILLDGTVVKATCNSSDTLRPAYLILFSESMRSIGPDCSQCPRWPRLMDTG